MFECPRCGKKTAYADTGTGKFMCTICGDIDNLFEDEELEDIEYDYKCTVCNWEGDKGWEHQLETGHLIKRVTLEE